MATGTVKKVIAEKGFGFISNDEAEGSDRKDIFYHQNSLTGDLAERKLQEGDKVTYDIEQSEKGPNAVNIALVE